MYINNYRVNATREWLENKLGETCKMLTQFEILYSGWECDGDAWVFESKSGKRHLVMTNHGTPYLADAAEVRASIAYYEDTIASSKAALGLLANK